MRRLTALLLLLLLLPACAAPVDPDEARESIQVIAMDTAMLITTYGERSSSAAYAAEDVIRDLEAKLSRTDPDSEVSRLNSAGKPVTMDRECSGLISIACDCWLETGGAFDITVAPVVSAWGFTADGFQVPSQEEIDRLLELVDGSRVSVTQLGAGGGEVCLGPGQSIDLGGIAKGYAAGKIADVFQEYEVPRGLAQLGGNVLAWGDRPGGTPWRVGIQDPARPGDQNAFAGVLELTDAFAVTSGGYQRYFEENGKTYHHILNPATGYPADSGLTSVTVVADCGSGAAGAVCDALSTACFIMGEEKALELCRKGFVNLEVSFELVLVTKDGRVVVTEGLADRFTLDETSGYTYEIVS